MRHLKIGFLFIIALLAIDLKAQNSMTEIELQVEKLVSEKNVDEVNKIIARTPNLPPTFILKTLTANLKNAKEQNDLSSLANTYIRLGSFWQRKGENLKAYDVYLDAEKICRNNKIEKLLGICLMNKSLIISEKKEQIKYLTEAVSIFKNQKDTLNLIKAHLNLGIIYSNNIDTDSKNSEFQINKTKQKVFQHYQKADSLNLYLKNKFISAALLTYYAEWFTFENEYEKALKNYIEAEKIVKEIGQIQGQINTLLEIAKIEVIRNHTARALQLLNEAKELAIRYEYENQLIKIYKEYSNLYEKKGDYNSSLKYYKLYEKTLTELNNQNSQDKIHLLSLEYDISEAQHKIDKYEAQTKRNRIISLLSFVLLISIALISYFTIQNKRRKIENLEKNKIITEIQLKNQQLEEELLKEKVSFTQNHLVTIANLSNKILNFLDELKLQVKELSHNSMYQQGINDLRVSFSKILNDKSILTEINTISSELNQDFFIYIRKNYPEVTKKDEQLLSFIILDMTSKEIGKILNITTESVYIKRHRLRKKLNLKSSDSIPEFYENTLKILTI